MVLNVMCYFFLRHGVDQGSLFQLFVVGPGCLQLLEIYWNLKTLLEIIEISLNLYGLPGNVCIKCRFGFQSR